VVPSIAQNILTVVRPDDCLGDEYGLQNCTEARGGVFSRNGSSTWIDNGDNDVDPMNTGIFKRTITFGLDTVGIVGKLQGSKIKNQTIGLMHTPFSSYLGTLGISPVPVNYTEDHIVKETFFDRLRASTRIASRTIAYTAGAFSRNLTGSLILGGFDASRLADSSTSILMPFTDDRLRELSVGVKDITFTDTINPNTHAPNRILEDPLVMPIDPYVSRIWLPKKVCDQFARSMNVTLDGVENLYYISEKQHSDFIARNTTFIFTLTDPLFQGAATEIKMPYELLALNAIYPLTKKPGRYLPIQVAVTPNTIVLGRAFLQAAYFIADYDRRTLNISQAKLDDVSESRVFIIPAPSNSTLNRGKAAGSESAKKKSLSAAAITGIVVLSIVLVIILLLFFRRRSRQKQYAQQEQQRQLEEQRQAQQQRDLESSNGYSAATPKGLARTGTGSGAGDLVSPMAELNANGNMLVEKDDSARVEMDGTGTPMELSPLPLTSELTGDSPVLEMEGSPVSRRDGKWVRSPLGNVMTEKKRTQQEEDVISKVIDDEQDGIQPGLRLETENLPHKK
jgi:hypothetical protein